MDEIPRNTLIIIGGTERMTRAVPPEYKSVPYSCTTVECPYCGLTWDIIDTSVKPGQELICGNALCQKSVIFPEYNSEVYGPNCISGVPLCMITAGEK